MLPLMLVATTLTALTVIVCSFLGAGKWAGYYPPALWSKVMARMGKSHSKRKGKHLFGNIVRFCGKPSGSL